jgi:hypothetical protein
MDDDAHDAIAIACRYQKYVYRAEDKSNDGQGKRLKANKQRKGREGEAKGSQEGRREKGS